MSTKIEISFNSEGFKEILEGDGVKGLVQDVTNDIVNRANANAGFDGFDGDVKHSPRMSKYGNGGRWVGFVRAKSYEAMADEAENKSLSKAVIG